MNILEREYEFIKVGRLEVATTNIYCPELAICEDKEECYSNFWQVEEIDRRLKEKGYRVTTREDLIYLAGLGSYWVKKEEKGNDIAGRFFGKKANKATIDNLNGCVFFPAAGKCSNSGTLNYQGGYAYYWSSTHFNTNYAYVLLFYSGGVYPGTNLLTKNLGATVRCVRNINV